MYVAVVTRVVLRDVPDDVVNWVRACLFGSEGLPEVEINHRFWRDYWAPCVVNGKPVLFTELDSLPRWVHDVGPGLVGFGFHGALHDHEGGTVDAWVEWVADHVDQGWVAWRALLDEDWEVDEW